MFKLFSTSILLFIIVFSSSCKKEKKLYNGYIDADYVYISPCTNGKISAIYVSKGESIKKGTKLFKLIGKKEEADFEIYIQAAKGVSSYLEDMKKGARAKKLEMWTDIANGVGSLSEGSGIGTKIIGGLEKLHAEAYTKLVFVSHVHKALNEISKGLKTWVEYQKLPQRPDQIAAVESLKNALNAEVAYSKWLKGQTVQLAPENAYVLDTFYRAGEYVQTGKPVVALLPPKNIKAQFFVDGITVNSLKLGETVLVVLTGESAPIAARISYISTKPEYTDPQIYSLKNNEKYTYLIEAKFQQPDALKLHPGQPIEVRLKG